MDGKTQIFSTADFDDKNVERILEDVYYALEDRGYDPLKQLVGYLTSGDPGYISSHLEARRKICSIERSKILEVVLRNYLKDIKWNILV